MVLKFEYLEAKIRHLDGFRSTQTCVHESDLLNHKSIDHLAVRTETHYYTFRNKIKQMEI